MIIYWNRVNPQQAKKHKKWLTYCPQEYCWLEYLSLQIYEVPFYVAVDHLKRAVVVSIRGSMSLQVTRIIPPITGCDFASLSLWVAEIYILSQSEAKAELAVIFSHRYISPRFGSAAFNIYDNTQ